MHIWIPVLISQLWLMNGNNFQAILWLVVGIITMILTFLSSRQFNSKLKELNSELETIIEKYEQNKKERN